MNKPILEPELIEKELDKRRMEIEQEEYEEEQEKKSNRRNLIIFFVFINIIVSVISIILWTKGVEIYDKYYFRESEEKIQQSVNCLLDTRSNIELAEYEAMKEHNGDLSKVILSKDTLNIIKLIKNGETTCNKLPAKP